MKYLIIAMALLLGACSEEGVAHNQTTSSPTNACVLSWLSSV